MMTTVVNISDPSQPKLDVYIGRRKDTHEHYGNPFPIGSEYTRETSIQACDDWLAGRAYLTVEQDRRLWILANLPYLRDRVLGCHCKPEGCHGDIYVRMVDVEAIWDFSIEPYRCFSNFSEHPVVYSGITYQTPEHAYQAAKAVNKMAHDHIASSVSAALAKRRGRNVTLRFDWENVKLGIMAVIVYSKFTQHEDARKILISTGNSLLIEGNRWGDDLWGMIKGEQGVWIGQNLLGKVLMSARDMFVATAK
jgi:ribA/ribD-fused uncharacterized protein